MAKKKPFGFSGILKVRTYNELAAMQKMLQETLEDNKLAAKYEVLQQGINGSIRELEEIFDNNNAIDSENLKNMYDYISNSKISQELIVDQRNALAEQVANSKRKYNEVRLELEAVKILANKQKISEKKQSQRAKLNEMQEKIICQNSD